MGAYDEFDEILGPERPRRAATVIWSIAGAALAAGIIAVVVVLGASSGPSARPPEGSGTALAHELVTALDDDREMAALLPAETDAERAEIRAECAAPAAADATVMILDAGEPSRFRAVLGQQDGCLLAFRWVAGDGWTVTVLRS
jgi:hypothetical protein